MQLHGIRKGTDMNEKGYKVLISVLALVFSSLSAGMGYGFMGNASFQIKFLCGFVFMMTPLSVAWLVSALFRK